MFRILMTGAALSLALGAGGPALAQDTSVTDPAQPGGVTQPGGVQPGQQQPGQQQTPGNTGGAASQVATIINSEFPTYDADASGDLNKAEFSKWMLALKQQELQATGTTLNQAELTQWAEAAFGSADTDKSGAVSKEELTRYLGG